VFKAGGDFEIVFVHRDHW